MRRGLAGAGLLALPFAASAATTIDFNSMAEGLVASPMVVTDAGGSGVDVTFSTNETFSIQRVSSQKGNAILSALPSKDVITITFSSLVSNFSLDAGDYGADDDETVSIQLLGSSDNLLDTVSGNWNSFQDIDFGPYLHLESGAAGVKTVIFSSGGVFPNSLYVDNVTFSVPEPASMVALGLGLLGVARKRLSRRSG